MLIVFCKHTCEVNTQYTEHLNNTRCHILDMNPIILIVSVRTIFGHTPISDNFWTEISLTSRTSDGLGQIFV